MPAAGVFHHREGFRQDLVELPPLSLQVGKRGQLRLPGGCFRPKLVVGERLELLVELVDTTYGRHQALDLALIFRSEYFL